MSNHHDHHSNIKYPSYRNNNKQQKTRVVYGTYIGIEPFTIHDLDVPTFQFIYLIVTNGNDVRCALGKVVILKGVFGLLNVVNEIPI